MTRRKDVHDGVLLRSDAAHTPPKPARKRKPKGPVFSAPLFAGCDRGVMTSRADDRLLAICVAAAAWVAVRPLGWEAAKATNLRFGAVLVPWYAAGDAPVDAPLAIMQAETSGDLPLAGVGWSVTDMNVEPSPYVAAGYGQGTFLECYLGANPSATPVDQDVRGKASWPAPRVPMFGGFDGEPLLRDVLHLLDPLKLRSFALFTGDDQLRPEDADTLLAAFRETAAA